MEHKETKAIFLLVTAILILATASAPTYGADLIPPAVPITSPAATTSPSTNYTPPYSKDKVCCTKDDGSCTFPYEEKGKCELPTNRWRVIAGTSGEAACTTAPECQNTCCYIKAQLLDNLLGKKACEYKIQETPGCTPEAGCKATPATTDKVSDCPTLDKGCCIIYKTGKTDAQLVTGDKSYTECAASATTEKTCHYFGPTGSCTNTQNIDYITYGICPAPAKGAICYEGKKTHTYKLNYTSGTYRAYIDNIKLGETASSTMPDSIFIGNDVTTKAGGDWTNIKTNYITIKKANGQTETTAFDEQFSSFNTAAWDKTDGTGRGTATITDGWLLLSRTDHGTTFPYTKTKTNVFRGITAADNFSLETEVMYPKVTGYGVFLFVSGGNKLIFAIAQNDSYGPGRETLKVSLIDKGELLERCYCGNNSECAPQQICLPGQQRACERQNGACKGANQTCTVSLTWQGCTNNTYYANNRSYETNETTCNDGIDNDCDGTGDAADQKCRCTPDGARRGCPLQYGICKGINQTCAEGIWGSCSYGSDYERAETKCSDSKDNDCDGKTDSDDENCQVTGQVTGQEITIIAPRNNSIRGNNTAIFEARTSTNATCKYGTRQNELRATGTFPKNYTYHYSSEEKLPEGQQTYIVNCTFEDETTKQKTTTFTIDTTKPSAPVVNDSNTDNPANPEVTYNRAKLYARWNSTDDESGIDSYNYTVFNTSSTTKSSSDKQITEWKETTSTEQTASGLNLANKTKYYFAVIAKNKAGLRSETGYSDGITYIATAQNECIGICAGKCPECEDGKGCKSNSDCESKACKNKICQKPSCSDNIKNGNETGTDCGGKCKACASGERCQLDEDCMAGYTCAKGNCKQATELCTDLIKDGDETGVDCGGSCEQCNIGEPCTNNKDCISGSCKDQTCTVPGTTTSGNGTILPAEKGQSFLGKLLYVLLFILLAGGGYFIYLYYNKPKKKPTTKDEGHFIPPTQETEQKSGLTAQEQRLVEQRRLQKKREERAKILGEFSTTEAPSDTKASSSKLQASSEKESSKTQANEPQAESFQLPASSHKTEKADQKKGIEDKEVFKKLRKITKEMKKK